MFEPQVVSVPWEEGDTLPVEFGKIKGDDVIFFAFQFGKYEITDADSQFLDEMLTKNNKFAYLDGDVYRPTYIAVMPPRLARMILARCGNRILSCLVKEDDGSVSFGRARSRISFKMMMAWVPEVVKQALEQKKALEAQTA